MDYVIGATWWIATRIAIAFGCMCGLGVLVFLLTLAQQALT